MKQIYYCNAIAEPLREVSEMKPLFYKIAMKMRIYKIAVIKLVKYKFFRLTTKKTMEAVPDDSLRLQPGEWVEVRSMREISLTLDDMGKNKGLHFTPLMEPFCGKKFMIFKKVDKILLESTGELRKMRSPTFLLEGVYCDGSLQGGCGRSCFHFWRDVWLKRVVE